MRYVQRAQFGQAILLIALLSTGLLLFVALVVDGGFTFLARRQVQNAADAASRAGANALAQSPAYTDSEISKVVTSILAGNNCSAGGQPPCSFTASYIATSGAVVATNPTVGGGSIGSDASGKPAAGIKVTAQTTVPTFFAGLIGLNGLTVSASASAIYGSLGSASCATMFPTAINGFDPLYPGSYDHFADWTVNQCLLVKDDSGSPGSSAFGWVDMSGQGTSASVLSGWINQYALTGDTGCSNIITVGTSSADLDYQSGSMASLQSAIVNLINSANYNQVTVPVYDTWGNDANCSNYQTGHGTICYHIKGFGRFRITAVWESSGPQGNTMCPWGSATNLVGFYQSSSSGAKGVLGYFVGFVDANGNISPTAISQAKVVNVIN